MLHKTNQRIYLIVEPFFVERFVDEWEKDEYSKNGFDIIVEEGEKIKTKSLSHTPIRTHTHTQIHSQTQN